MSNLLYDEHPLIINPTLATKIGLNEAVVLQQVHYWLEIFSKTKDHDVMAKHYHDGRWWVYNTYEQWHEQLPFWCVRTLKTIFRSLENRKLLLVGNFNHFGYDRTKWYSIDYELLKSLENTHSANSALTEVQGLHSEMGKTCPSNTIDFPKTSSKEYVKCKMVRNSQSLRTSDFSYDILRKQLQKICRTDFPELDEEEVIDIIILYCKAYEYFMGKHHPKMQNKHYQRIITVIRDYFLGTDIEAYHEMIDKHFRTEYGKKIDYNMNHFFNEGILDNRMYETIY